MPSHSYRELNAPELVTWFAKITGGYIVKGRDARMLATGMEMRGRTPTQVLWAMYEFAKTPATKDMYSFCRSPFFMYCDEDWDEMQIEAMLVEYLTGKEMPAFAIAYFDLLDTGVTNAQIENYFEQAQAQLKEYLDDALNRPASLRAGSRAAGSNNQQREASTSPGRRRRTL